MRKTWKTIQEILFKTQKKISFREGETVVTCKMEIIFFTNTGPSLACKIRNDSNKNCNYYFKRNSTIVLKFTEIYEDTIIK